MAKKPPVPTIADNITQLENLVARMEDDDTTLEQSLQDFEQGIQLIRRAQQALLEAEQKVKLLLEKDGEPATASFADYSEGEDD